MGPANNVQANQKSDWVHLGAVADNQVWPESQRTEDDDASFRDRGRLFGSFRRTAARLQEYDGLDATGDLDREGLDWTRQPISQARSPDAIKGGRPGFPARWAKKISIPETASEYLVFFTTSGCIPCKRMYPVIEALEAEGYEIYVVKYELNRDMVRQHNVSSFPTILVFDDGKMVQRMGTTTKAEILKYLKKPTPPSPPDPFEPPPDRVNYDFVDGPSYRLW